MCHQQLVLSGNFICILVDSGQIVGARDFSSRHFFRPFRLSLAPTNCPWVFEDGNFEGDPSPHRWLKVMLHNTIRNDYF